MATVTGPLSTGTLVKAATHASASSQYGKKISSSTKGTAASGWYWDTANVATGKLISHTNLKKQSFSSNVSVTIKAPCAYTVTCNGTSKSGSRGTTTFTFPVTTTGQYAVVSTLTGSATSRNGGEYTKTTYATVSSTATAVATAQTYYQWLWRSGYGSCTYCGTLWQWSASSPYENVCNTSSFYCGVNALGNDGANGCGYYNINTANGYTGLRMNIQMQDTNNLPAYSTFARNFTTYIQYGTGSYKNVLNGWSTLTTKTWTLNPQSPYGTAAISGSITSGSSVGMGVASSNPYGLWRLWITQAYLT